MKIAYQWTTDPAAGWQWVDSRQWSSLPKKNEPVGGELIDINPGWIYRVCVQGVVLGQFDLYAVVHSDPLGGVLVAGVNYDPVDWPVGTRFGHIWLFKPVNPDGSTQQTLEFYGDNEILNKLVEVRLPDGTVGTVKLRDMPWYTTGGSVVRRAYNQWPSQSQTAIRYGIWVSDELAAAHSTFAPPTLYDWFGDPL